MMKRSIGHHTIRLTLWFTGTLIVCLLLTGLLLRFWILPNLDQWRPQIAASLSHASGQNIQLGKLDASWQGWHPVLHISRIQVLSRSGTPLITLNDIRAGISWTSLPLGELRLTKLVISNQSIALTRKADGSLWLDHYPIHQQTTSPDFADWLLRQPHLQLSHATLTWQDATRNSPVLAFNDLNLSLDSFFSHHRFHFSAIPSTPIAPPVFIDGNLVGRSLHDLPAWRGTLSVQATGIDLTQWQPWLTLPLGITHGYGNVSLSGQFAHARLTALVSQVRLRQLSLQFTPDLPRLNLLNLSGQASWQRQGNTQSIELKQVSLRNDALLYLAPMDFYLRLAPASAHTAAQGVLRCSNLSLGNLAQLASYLPLSPIQTQWLQQHQLSGKLRNINASWLGNLPQPNTFSLTGQFSDLSMHGNAAAPDLFGSSGFSGLSGHIDGNNQSGTVALSSTNVGLDLPKLLFEPHLHLNSLTAQLRWQQQKTGWQFNLAQANLNNADFSGNLFGSYDWQPGQPGQIDLHGGLYNARGSAACHYLPLVVQRPAYNWVCQNLLGGIAERAQFDLVGNLAHYPFHNDGQGLLNVHIAVKDASIRPNPDFPRINHIQGSVDFEGTRMLIHSDNARLYQTKLRHILVQIPDLFAHDKEYLQADGQADGKIADFIQFVNASPVKKALDNLTANANGTGNTHLDLHIKLPFHDILHPDIAGTLHFQHDNVKLSPQLPSLDDIHGFLQFTQTGVNANDIRLQLFHQPAVLNSTSQSDGSAQIHIQGQIAQDELDHWIPNTLAQHFHGKTPWHATLSLLRGKVTDITAGSNLDGLAIDLPPPLNKTASQSLALHWDSHNTSDGHLLANIHYDDRLQAQLLAYSDQGSLHLDRGSIVLGGGHASLPAHEGLDILGTLDNIQLEDWFGLLSGQGSALPIHNVDLTVRQLQLFHHDFQQVTLSATQQNTLWLAHLSGPRIQGDINWFPAKPSYPQGKLVAQFKTLDIPPAQPSAPASASAPDKPNDNQDVHWPEMQFQVDDLQVDHYALGKLNLHATPIPGGMHIDPLTVSNPDSTFAMTADWHLSGTPQTQAQLHLSIHRLGGFLARYHQPDTIARGTAQLDGNASWNGTPMDIPIGSLNGQFTLHAMHGQFLKLDPGAAKLLGILSLQDLPHHITLDFRDVFSNGFAFDDISATILLNHGIIGSSDFMMQGPAATVHLQGSVNIHAQTENLKVSVSPKLSESVALASSFVGGPVVGLSMLAIQKLLSNPIGEALRYNYDITGSWHDPVVQKTGL